MIFLYICTGFLIFKKKIKTYCTCKHEGGHVSMIFCYILSFYVGSEKRMTDSEPFVLYLA